MAADALTFMGIISVLGGGSIPPVMTLADGLRSRGHRVVMVCDEGSVDKVERAGLTPIVVPPEVDFTNYWGDEEFRRERLNFIELGLNSISHMRNMVTSWAEDAMPVILDEVKRHSPDIYFASLFSGGLARSLAGETGAPWCMLNPSYFHGDGALHPIENDFTGFSVHLFREWLNPVVDDADIVLHTVTPEFDPVPGGLPPGHHHTGPLDRPVEAPPMEILDKPGDPWVLVSVSTGPQPGELQIVQSSIEILAEKPFRVLATTPKRSAEFDNLPSNAHVVEFASHDEVMKRSRFIIGHAGQGGVNKALIHGVPMVLVPWDRDQPGVAARAEQLGVAVVVPREELSTSTLKSAIERLLSDENYAQRASEISEQMAQQRPLETACELLEAAVRG